MLKDQKRCAAKTPDAIGIVVKNAQPRTEPSRAASFVWGMGLYPTPSLPFGRWKQVATTG